MRQDHAGQHNFNDINATKDNFKSQTVARETCVYIADMLLELRNLAKSTGQKTLQGLLEISYYEAYSAANKTPIPEGEVEFIQQLGADVRRAEGAA
jgi:hypothetical protein